MITENTRNGLIASASAVSSMHVRPSNNGALVTVSVPRAGHFILDFDPADLQAVSRQSNDLVFTFPGGGTTVLHDFFTIVAESGGMDFVLPDGTEMAVKDFLHDYDIETASGLTASNTGGAGAYNDDPGALVDGVDKLGALGKVSWSSLDLFQEDIILPSANANQSGLVGTTGNIKELIVGPVDPDTGNPIAAGGAAATVEEGGDLVFTIGQNAA
ncbi:MAG: hypothetical protein LBN33_01250, partial [Desulfovibrio sp.]|nr:hypothetical protein [Desulfovibrio sp.]